MAVDVIRLAPKSAFSNVVGWGARRQLPRALRAPLYGAFANVVGAKLGEVEHSLSDYKSFGAFFSRGLKPGARTLPEQPDQWSAPCDCRVAEVGDLRQRSLQAKGHSFSLRSLLASDSLAELLQFGDFLTLYLSPRDYHRVHAPTDCRLVGYQYVPGSLYPVSPFYRKHIDDIFSVNERIVLELESSIGTFALVMVGAAGVGNLRLKKPSLESRHLRSTEPGRVQLTEPIELARGQELGAFELGSTVILCLPKEALTVHATVGHALQFGDVIASQGDPQ